MKAYLTCKLPFPVKLIPSACFRCHREGECSCVLRKEGWGRSWNWPFPHCTDSSSLEVALRGTQMGVVVCKSVRQTSYWGRHSSHTCREEAHSSVPERARESGFEWQSAHAKRERPHGKGISPPESKSTNLELRMRWEQSGKTSVTTHEASGWVPRCVHRGNSGSTDCTHPNKAQQSWKIKLVPSYLKATLKKVQQHL